jgi:VWFA-related protein
LLLLALPAAGLAQVLDQQPPPLRSGVVMVPVDVRVFDRQGNPVTNLRVQDFTILEDGVPQEIVHFSINRMAPGSSAASGDGPVLSARPGLEAAPATHRTFLIVLSRGRLQGPVRGMDALIDFVAHRLHPQDRVGVVAYRQITDLTRDHAAVVRLLERYRDRHEAIETLLRHWFSGLQLAYGSPDFPSGAQADVDAIFDGDGLPPSRRITFGGLAGDGEFESHRSAAADTIEALGRRAYHVQERQDFEQLFGAIDALRYIDGEKHVVLVSEEGLFPSRLLNGSLALMAADARVTISPLHTGGVPLRWDPPNLATSGGGPPQLIGRTPMQVWAVTEARHLARSTGGLAALYQRGRAALDRLSHATAFSYLLGYAPAADWDGSYRRIDVRVNRRDAETHFRRGYFAQRDLAPYEPGRILTEARIMSAASSATWLRDLPVTLSRQDDGRIQPARPFLVSLHIDASRLAFAEADGDYRASVHVALFGVDNRENPVGEFRDSLELALSAEQYREALATGLTRTIALTVSARPRFVKVVVYDPTADRLGTDSLLVR